MSGDGDFAYPVRRLLEMGKRVRIVSTRYHLAHSLRESGAEVVYLEQEWAPLLVPRRVPDTQSLTRRPAAAVSKCGAPKNN